ncbi:MAG: serine hydrolase [Kiritimatiellales bacterium]
MFRAFLFFISIAFYSHAQSVRARAPYYGAVVIDAKSGTLLDGDRAALQGFPASMTKLANLFVLFDDLTAGKIHLTDQIKISREVALIGGRQVWLKEGEVFPVEELIYAMMVHSANDAAAALAIHASGSRAAHASRMTAKAKELGLYHTEFHSVHGLPPEHGQKPDTSSALDIARLSRALLEQYPQTLKYTSVRTRSFRADKPMVLTSSNKLLGSVPGCDGLKTGFIQIGGFSLAATAKRDGKRVIAVILGSKEAKVRDAKAAEWIEKGFVLWHKVPPEMIDITERAAALLADHSEPVPDESAAYPKPVFILVSCVIGTIIILIFMRFRHKR